MSASDTIEAEGHLIDSGLLSAIFDKIIEFKGVLRDPDVRHRPHQRRRVAHPDAHHRARRARRSTICCSSSRRSAPSGPRARRAGQAGRKGPLRPRRLLLDDQPPHARAPRRAVGRGRASSAWTRSSSSTAARAACRKLRDVKAGEPVVCGHDGIRVTPEFRERDRLGFAFMSNDVSSERRVEGSVSRIAADDARGRRSRAAASPSSPDRSSCTPAASSTSPR